MTASGPATLNRGPAHSRRVAPPELRILVVDDEPDVREAVASLLEVFLDNPQVRVAASGGEGLSALRGCEVDLIVTDFKMPGMNGGQFLAEADKLCPGTPHILLTAFDREAVQAMGARADPIVHKPFEPDQLLQAVDQALAA